MTARAPSGADGAYRGFLFADLRGYSADVERHGDRAASVLLDAYRALVRRQVALHAGAEIKTEGDSFYVVFPSAQRAVLCALDIIEAAAAHNAAGAGLPVRVGIGVHAGEVVDGSEGYVGSAVNIAARVCAIARAGEVLVTRTVRDLTRTGLMLDYVPRGARRLKGIAEPIDLYAVRQAREVPASGIGPRLRSLNLSRYRALGVTLAVGLLAFAIAILFGDALLGRGAANNAPSATSAQAGGSAGVSAGASAAVAAESPATTGAFPNDAETRLLSRLDDDLAATCGRADPDSTPTMYRFPQFFDRDNPVARPIPIVAGLSCTPFLESDPDLVEVWEAAVLQDMDDAFFGQTGDAALAPGECGIDERAYGRWEFGSAGGRILCIVGANEARLTWTYGEVPIIATAIREDADGALLFSWWRDNARILRPAGDD